jgi:hypothetical protein
MSSASASPNLLPKDAATGTIGYVWVSLGDGGNLYYSYKAAAAKTVPPITPTSEAPKLDVTTDYRAPALGAVGAYPMPTFCPVGRRTARAAASNCGTHEFDGEIRFVDDQGNVLQGPDEVALQAQAERAQNVCLIMIYGDWVRNSANTGSIAASFAACVNVVAQVLARADQIKRRSGQARAAATACVQQLHASRRGVRPTFLISCTPTGGGMRIKIRPRSKGQSLSKALGGHALMLVVARSSIASGPTRARLEVRWHAS